MDALLSNATDTFVASIAEKFTWYDYVLFVLMLGLSALIGIYFGFFGKKQDNADEYLLGGKEMGVFPIALSLIACFVSGITILAVPADVYQYGSTYWLTGLMLCVVNIIAVYLTIPVFFKLQISSTYAYLQLRFSERVRKMCSFLYAIHMFLYLPIVIYVPALALSQGTGFNVHMITPVICGVCIFYTTIGGLKAVVWTDALQFIVMIGSTVIVTYLGTSACGGFWEVLKVAKEGGRTDIEYELDLTKRDGFWAMTLGMIMMWMGGIGVGQSSIQKCVALPSMAHVKKAFVIFGFGIFVFIGCSVYTGLMIYAKYSKCDPLKSEVVSAHDQLLPQFVMDVARDVPGLAGLFIAGVFSAALSSLSACMNCLSCTIFEDFISGYLDPKTSQKKISNILKLLVMVIGIICTALVFVVEHLGGILELGFSLGGATNGPILGIFLLGLFFRKANSKGAIAGAMVALAIMSWIVFGARYYKLQNRLYFPTKPITVEGCSYPYNNTIITPFIVDPDLEPWYIFRISHYFYSVLGVVITITVGMIVSLVTQGSEPPVKKDLLSPLLSWFNTKDDEPETPPPTYVSVEKGRQLVEKNSES